MTRWTWGRVLEGTAAAVAVLAFLIAFGRERIEPAGSALMVPSPVFDWLTVIAGVVLLVAALWVFVRRQS